MGRSLLADRPGTTVTETTARRASNAAPHAWLERTCIVIPALDAERSLSGVIAGLRQATAELADRIIVVDDGSRDRTARIAEDAGCVVVIRPANGGKGAALRSGFEMARARGMSVALTVDADGQHPPEEARSVLFASDDPKALVLGVRDLVEARAPRANRFSNGISNYFLSRFAGRRLRDTQCGLRRYPLAETLALPTRGQGYDFEAEVLLRAIWTGIDVVEAPVRVLYPKDRTTHFRIGRDVRRIIRTVLDARADQRRSADGRIERA